MIMQVMEFVCKDGMLMQENITQLTQEASCADGNTFADPSWNTCISGKD